ncbi:MAG: VWA-like domain-containing protein [Bacillota bacterium]|nr:VWA-like domain-containing protein [Bacillota bacterium]
MKINEVIMKLLISQPFYGNLAVAVAAEESTAVKEIVTTYFPAPVFHYNRTWFEELDANKAQGRIIHELLHLTLMHPLRREGRDRLLWETACDMAVNEYIPEELLMDSAVTADRVAKEMRSDLPGRKSAEFYYDLLLNLQDGISFFEQDNKIHLRFGSGVEMTVNEQAEEGDLASDVAVKAMKSMMFNILADSLEDGDFDQELSLQYDDIYREYHVDWRNIFKRFLIGRGRIDSRKSYKRESRRHDGFPGNKRSIGLKCLLAIDESGSIQDGQIVEFYDEIIGINRITSAEIFVTEFDVSCTRPVPMERYKMQPKRVKNGGTDFRPVFEMADRMKIELLVIFTDGKGAVPASINQRVLWVLSKGGKKPCEYGYAVELK